MLFKKYYLINNQIIFWSVKMSSTIVKETTSVKLDKAAKEEAKNIFNQLGLTMGEAFNFFYTKLA
jgi:hypothetical protein